MSKTVNVKEKVGLSLMNRSLTNQNFILERENRTLLIELNIERNRRVNLQRRLANIRWTFLRWLGLGFKNVLRRIF